MSSSRSHRAAALARRVQGHHVASTEAARWSSLAALWLHLGVVIALRGLGPAVRAEPDVRFVEVIRQPSARPGAERGVQPGPATLPSPPAPAPDLRVDGAIAAPSTDPAPDRTPRRTARTERRTVEQPPDVDVISAHDVWSDTLRHAPVTADTDGLPTPPSDGAAELAASPTLERRRGDPQAASGNRADGERAPVVLGGGGGAPVAAAGDADGAPQEGKAQDDGGARGSGSPGADDRGSAAVGAAAPPTPTAPMGEHATLPDSGPAPGWWQPMAVRLAPSPTPPASPGAIASHTPALEIGSDPTGAGSGHGERLGRRGAQGGARVVAEAVTASDPRDAPPSPEPRGLRRIAAVGTADPVAELREALGFGPLDRDKLAPRPAWAGATRQVGMQDSSSQAAIEAPIAWRTAFSARATAEGAYLQRVSERIEARWSTQDLDLHSRATGVQGEVTLRYEIRRDGRIVDVRVVRSSGNAALDGMATAAIPPRVDRFPADLVARALQHEVTFRYRNPLVGP